MDECHLTDAPVVTNSTKVADSTMPWPLQGIEEPHENDVLCGRGGGTNNHLGNKRYRDLVKENNPNYAMAARIEKGPIVAAMVHSWRTTQDPPGRFLKKSVDNLWEDVGDKVAKEKTSQLFREIKVQGMKLKKNASGDEERSDDSLSGDKEPTKIAFREQKVAIDESEPNFPPKQPVLKFVHSLGESSLEPGENFSLHDFEWNEGLDPLPLSYVPSQTGDPSSDTVLPDNDIVVPRSSAVSEEDAIEGSQSWRSGHADSPTQDDGRMVALPPMGPPQAILPLQAEETYGSGSYHHGPRLSVPLTALNEAHSLGGLNLPGASILSQAVPFESRRSMTWEPISMPSSILMTTDKPGQHRNYARLVSDEELNDENCSILHLSLKHGAIQPSIMTSPGGFASESNAPLSIVSPVQENCHVSSENHGTKEMINCSTDSNTRKVSDVDPVTTKQLWTSVANGCDSGALHSSWSGEVPAPLNPFDSYNQHKSESVLSRPDMVKRMTSNQNEDETSKLGFASGSVKRAALNRDASARSNALKAQYNNDALRPDILEKRQVSVEEIDFLRDSFQQSRLNMDERPRPSTIDDRVDDRTVTDSVALSALTAGKPASLSSIDRRTTIEAIEYDLGFDMDFNHNDDDNAAWPYRPSALSREDRMSTAEYFLED